MSDGAVAVVMPAFNAEQFIGEALESVFAQTVAPSQIVVADDGSTDATAAIASADPRVTVLRRPHAGISAMRNAAIAECRCEHLAFLDADDVWLPRKLELQLAALAEHGTDAAFCRADEFWDADIPIEGSGLRAPQVGVDAPLMSALLIRRSIANRIGSFADASVGDWINWWSRARAQGVTEVVVPEVLLRRRIHGENNSHRNADQVRPVLLQTVRDHLRATRPDDT